MRLIRKGVGVRIAARIAGVLGIELVNARLSGGALQMAQDPQIHFSVKPYLLTSSVMMQLTVVLEAGDGVTEPKLYVDYGGGFTEDAAGKLVQSGKDTWIGYVPVPQMARKLRLDLQEEPGTARIASITAHRAALTPFVNRLLATGERTAAAVAGLKAEAVVHLLQKMHATIAHGNEDANHAVLATAIAYGFNRSVNAAEVADAGYLSWIDRHEALDERDLAWMARREAEWDRRPLLSVLMPVFEPPLDLLDEAIKSLQAQAYANWELCIADDASRDRSVRDLIAARAEKDPRIRYVFRSTNGHISEATNSAAELARGDFLVLMDNDDTLPPHALWTVAEYVDRHPDGRMFYSDEDKISPGGFRCQPYHKGGFDRFLLYGHNMFSHLGVYERALFDEVGGFRKGYEGSQDYDLTLRCMEKAGEGAIVHIPHVLYHWRQIEGSTSMGAGQKNYAFEASKKSINDHFRRCGYPLASIDSDVPGVAAVRTLSQAEPAVVSVIIPTRDGLEYLRPCVESLLAHPDPLMEIVIVDNGSEKRETLEYLEGLERDGNRFKVVRSDTPFNFSHLTNLGVAASRGSIVCLLNNDTEVLSGGIFERARGWLAVPDVGVVGARLLYPDMTVQHFGVYTGVNDDGIAEHAYVGLHDSTHANFSKSRLLQQFMVVTGACLFMRRADYDAAGGLDEGLAVAYNDVDLCLKARRHGLKVICDPAIRLVHKESKSRGHDNTPEKRARLNGEVAKMKERWGKAGLVDTFLSPNMTRKNASLRLAEKPVSPVPWKDPRPFWTTEGKTTSEATAADVAKAG